MEAHRVLLERGIDVKSYGAGNHVKLPGASRDNPNTFSFGGRGQKSAIMFVRLKDSADRGAPGGPPAGSGGPPRR